MAKNPSEFVTEPEGAAAAEVPSETGDVDFSFINVMYQGKTVEVPWPSQAATNIGVVACSNGHPNMANPQSGEISCGCGSTEVAS